MELKAILCTVCGAPIGEGNIDLRAGKVVCSHCGTVFRTEGFAIPKWSSTFRRVRDIRNFRCRPEEIDFIEHADRVRSVARTFFPAGAEDIRIGTPTILKG